MFDPKNIYNWYAKKSTWKKVLLFIVFVVAILLSVVWFVLGRMASPASKAPNTAPDAHTTTGAIEEHFSDTLRHAEGTSDKIDSKITEEEKLREELKKERIDANQNGREEKKTIDDADSVSAVVNVLNKRRGAKPKRSR